MRDALHRLDGLLVQHLLTIAHHIITPGIPIDIMATETTIILPTTTTPASPSTTTILGHCAISTITDVTMTDMSPPGHCLLQRIIEIHKSAAALPLDGHLPMTCGISPNLLLLLLVATIVRGLRFVDHHLHVILRIGGRVRGDDLLIHMYLLARLTLKKLMPPQMLLCRHHPLRAMIVAVVITAISRKARLSP